MASMTLASGDVNHRSPPAAGLRCSFKMQNVENFKDHDPFMNNPR